MSASPPRPVPPRLEPYRVLFPLGLTYAVIGAGLWPVHALLGTPYPGVLHRLMMIQGFEQCFVLGFLLTAMAGLTKGPRCSPVELALAAGAAVTFGVAAVAGALRVAEGAFLASLVVLVVAMVRRARGSTAPKPMELLFVAFGLLCGFVGGALQLAAGGVDVMAGRVLSQGMVLSLVLGLGGLLVPTFTGVRAPLQIPGVAGPHEGRGRAIAYPIVIAALVAALVLEATSHARAGAAVRALAATWMIVQVWKLVRPPSKRDAPGLTMWSSGWILLVGLWMPVFAPALTLGALHVEFIGGFALLTVTIATRVVVAHGQYPLVEERRVLPVALVATLLATLLVRLAAEWFPAAATWLLAASGTLWVVGWTAWAARAVPRVAVLRSTPARLP